MGLLRYNPLELIGRDRRKYHSAIITCYSFDFNFFENRVMPVFGSCGIKNVIVLMDGKQLNITLEETNGREYSKNKMYSFYPMYSKAAFHPKIMLLVGKRHGFLAIGSGNLTASGLSTNDEIWGAFQMSDVGSVNAPIFGATWKYLSTLFDQIKGFTKPIEWIHQYAPWVHELPIPKEEHDIGKTAVWVLNSASKSSILSRVLKILPKNKACEMVVASPYFEKNGNLIQSLMEQVQTTSLKCLIDPQHGILPYNINEELHNQIEFYLWKDCVDDYEHLFNRLHAKFFHFKYKDEEYLLFGSPNATTAGLGSLTAKGDNEECALLIKRKGNVDYLKELGINLPSDPRHRISLGDISGTNNHAANTSTITHQYGIEKAEIDGGRLSIYFNQSIPLDLTIVLYDRWNQVIEELPITKSGSPYIMEVDGQNNAFKICLTQDTKRMSNYSLISRIQDLIKNNPDPDREKLDHLLDSDFENGEGITELLHYADFQWADEDSKDYKKSRAGHKDRNTPYEATKEYEVLDPEQFNQLADQNRHEHHAMLENSSIKIAAFLSFFSKGIHRDYEEDLDEIPEQSLMENINESGTGEAAHPTHRTSSNGRKEQRAFNRYFTKLDGVYTFNLKKFYTSSLLKSLSDQDPVTLKSTSNFLIGLSLVHLYAHKTFLEEEIDIQYISHGALADRPITQKGFLVHLLGKFNLLSYRSFKKYEYDIINEKLADYRKELFMKSIFWILNTYWSNSEKAFRDILLLDLLNQNVGMETLEDPYIQEELKALSLEAHRINPKYEGQVNDFLQDLLPRFITWHEKFSTPEYKALTVALVQKLPLGSLLYTSKFGFYQLKGKTKGESGWHLDISKPGLLIDPKKQVPLQKNIQLGYKVVLFQ